MLGIGVILPTLLGSIPPSGNSSRSRLWLVWCACAISPSAQTRRCSHRCPTHARVLDAWRADYNGVRPHSALANRTPEEFRAHHIAVAVSAGSGQNFNPGLYF